MFLFQFSKLFSISSRSLTSSFSSTIYFQNIFGKSRAKVTPVLMQHPIKIPKNSKSWRSWVDLASGFTTYLSWFSPSWLRLFSQGISKFKDREILLVLLGYSSALMSEKNCLYRPYCPWALSPFKIISNEMKGSVLGLIWLVCTSFSCL